jgi:hypothetical protein
MMTFRNFGEYVSAEPFQPFRIKMASGQAYEIRHPEMILVGRSSVRVYTSTVADSEKPPHWHDVSMMLMETLEPIDIKSVAGIK